MAYNQDFKEFQLEGDDLVNAKKASAKIREGLQEMAKILQKREARLSSGPETVTIDFDPGPGGQARDGQTHTGGPGPDYEYKDPPGVCRPK